MRPQFGFTHYGQRRLHIADTRASGYDFDNMANAEQMTIIVFADTILGPNGVRSYYLTLHRWAKRTGRMRMVVLSPADDAETAPDEDHIGIRPWFRVPNPFYRDLVLGHYSVGKLTTFVRGIAGPKIIHIASAGPLGLAGARVARRLGLPAVGCYHVDTPACSRLYGTQTFGPIGGWLGAGLARILDRRAYGSCRALYAPSQSAADAARCIFHQDVDVIPNPVDLSDFQPAASRQGDFRTQYNPEGKILAIVVGRVAREKNLDLVGKHLLSDSRIQTVFVGDGPYAATMRERYGAAITGFLRGQQLKDAFQQADLLVQLSVAETFGLALVEAMASGLPSVVLRSRGFVEHLPPGASDILELDELDTLASRCVALHQDRARYADMIARAREHVQQLSVEHVIPRVADWHQRFVNGSRFANE